ncbi:MAG: low molecular weight phosphatase family protein [Nanoarchaeota archaeon]
MNVLFVCYGNVGRSQIAEAFFNRYASKHNHADSAGTHVDGYDGKTGQTLEEFAGIESGAKNVIIVMDEEGIDVSECRRTQITKEMLDNYDKIFVMAWPQECPDYLIKHSNVKFWKVENPVGTGYDVYKITREKIKSLVRLLVSDLG